MPTVDEHESEIAAPPIDPPIPPTQFTSLPDSTYMDFSSWRSNTTEGPTGGTPAGSGVVFNVALVLDRANDPTALLQQMNWAERQQELKSLADNGTLWSTYGADQTKYNDAITELQTLGFDLAPLNGYVSTPESRTIWVQVTGDNFSALFGPDAKLMVDGSNGGWYWTGNLSLPSALTEKGVSGLWFDAGAFDRPVVANPGTATTAAKLPQGWQSPGNGAPHDDKTVPYPQQIGETVYNMPLGSEVQTGKIGLIEPGVGDTLPNPTPVSFEAGVNLYRANAGVPIGAPVTAVAGGGQSYNSVAAGERTLDVAIAATVSPNSPLFLYAGSGSDFGAQSNTYTAWQSSFWDTTNNPEIVSSSFGLNSAVAPGSPFYKAISELFTDAALRNISVFNAAADGGSGNEYGNGLPNTTSSRSSPYAVMVGGTSVSTAQAAQADPTLQSLVDSASRHDPATLWQLIEGGLTVRPGDMGNPGATFVETIWNEYYLDGKKFEAPREGGTSYLSNNTGAGGVDVSQPTPWYQTDYGLTPTTSDPSHQSGRGIPDMSANAGGNMAWFTPPEDFIGNSGGTEGTSAATPFWAALTAQFNAIFKDQGLPQLGFMNDLLYNASAIKIASFNDITIGNNTSSFVMGGDYIANPNSQPVPITPTGYGYEAGPGYDLASGLGTPNGTLLARALTEIAHHQTSYADSPDLLEAVLGGGWQTGDATQSILIQATTAAGTAVHVGLGSESIDFNNGDSSQFAWTARLAQQSLQDDFDPNLVRMFDKASQGGLFQSDVDAGSAISVTVGDNTAAAKQGTLTGDYGFANFFASNGAIDLARAVAVAETAGAANDQSAVVRMRQNGEDNLSVSFYRVDDYSGKIGALSPGEAGYNAAAVARMYSTQQGGTAVDGPGYGLYAQTEIVHVNSGDLIAMQLTNRETGDVFRAFSQANERVDGAGVGHLWNYGSNTWGWEDTYGGGDRDFNDLIVQLDFTSASGHGWLV